MKNTAIVDIDGVLADYRLGLLWWINTHYPNLRDICYRHLSRIDTWINHESMGISFREWLDILERFRMSGGKLLIPECPGASDFLKYLKDRGVKVVLVTSRPFDIYSNIYKDTVEWLVEKQFHYHLLLFSKSKADIIYKLRLTDEILFTVDDELGHIKQYVELGLKSYWLNHYKASCNIVSPDLITISNLGELIAKEEENDQEK